MQLLESEIFIPVSWSLNTDIFLDGTIYRYLTFNSIIDISAKNSCCIFQNTWSKSHVFFIEFIPLSGTKYE